MHCSWWPSRSRSILSSGLFGEVREMPSNIYPTVWSYAESFTTLKNFLCSSWLFFPRLHPLIFLLENFNLSGVLFYRFLRGQSLPEPRAGLLWPANSSGPPDSGPTQCWGNKYVHHHAQLFTVGAGRKSSYLFNTCSHSVSHFPSPWSLSQGHCSYLTGVQPYDLIYLSPPL